MDDLRFDSPAQQVVNHLRRASILKRINMTPFPHYDDMEFIDKLHEVMDDCHVFDLGALFDDRAANYLGDDTCQMLWDEVIEEVSNEQFHLPFQGVILIERCAKVVESNWYTGNNGWFINIHIVYISEEQDERVIFICTFVHTPAPKGWRAITLAVVKREEGEARVLGPLCRHMEEEMAQQIRLFNTERALAAVALINHTGDAIRLDSVPALTPSNGRSYKGFERPNQVSLLRVLEPRLIRPKSYVPQSTGRDVEPHDRRAHWVTSKKGLRFWRGGTGIKIKGGASQATPLRKIVLGKTKRQ